MGLIRTLRAKTHKGFIRRLDSHPKIIPQAETKSIRLYRTVFKFLLGCKEETAMDPLKTFQRPFKAGLEEPYGALMEPLWSPYGALMEPYGALWSLKGHPFQWPYIAFIWPSGPHKAFKGLVGPLRAL